MTDALLVAHLLCAMGALALFWATALARKGGPFHRWTGRWFARFIYAAAASGGLLVLLGLLQASVRARHLIIFVLYMLIVIVAPVQHGLAAIAAGPAPLRVRSRLHATLNTAAILGAVLLFPAALIWGAWLFLPAVPGGFAIGLRNMRYAGRASAAAIDWQREHLTSLISGGIALHTAFFALSVTRWPHLVGVGWVWVPWLGPALIGLPVIVWVRRRT